MSSKIEITYVKDYSLCDRNHFHIVKGISVLAALAAYIAKTYYGVGNMSHIVAAAMAVFALCSGYGISESYNKKRGLVHYWENKVIKIWLPSLVVLVATSLIEKGVAIAWIREYPLGLAGNMLYLIFGGYAGFWLMFQLSDKRNVRLIGLFAMAVAAIFLVPQNLLIQRAMVALPVGILISQLGLKYRVRKFKVKGILVTLIACILVGTGCSVMAWMISIKYVTVILWNVAFTAIAMALLLLTWAARKLPVFGVFVPFGMISYGIFLLYDGVFILLEDGLSGQKLAVVLLILFAVAGVFTALRELLAMWSVNLRRRGKTHLKGSMW